MEEAIKLAAAEKKELKAEEKKAAKILMAQQCNNGCEPLPEGSDCAGFVNTFIDEYGLNRDEHLLTATINATNAANEKYPDVMRDSVKAGWILSYFLATLGGENDYARTNASIAIFFEQMIAIAIHKTQATLNHAKMMEMLCGDERTLVKYLRKRIPCNCLAEKYKEVKSITKMGVCSNPKCSLPIVERKGMLHCCIRSHAK